MSSPTVCVNHPGVQTRVSCSSCEAPICPRCMHQSAVGQKCPSCARLPRSARAGRPSHYLRAVGAGLGVAVVGGIVLAQVLVTVRFGGIILSGVLGLLVGRAVAWGARNQSQQPFPAIAAIAALTGVGLGLAMTPYGLFPPGLVVLGYPVAAWLAIRGVQG